MGGPTGVGNYLINEVEKELSRPGRGLGVGVARENNRFSFAAGFSWRATTGLLLSGDGYTRSRRLMSVISLPAALWDTSSKKQ